MQLSAAVRKRLGKRSFAEVQAELERMQDAYGKPGKPFDWKVYAYLKRELRRIDRIAVEHGGVARLDPADHDDWVRRRREAEAARVNGRREVGSPFAANPRTYCQVK